MGSPTGYDPVTGICNSTSRTDKLLLGLSSNTTYEWQMRVWYCETGNTPWKFPNRSSDRLGKSLLPIGNITFLGGGAWSMFEKCLKHVREVCGRCLGGVRKVFGRCSGGVWDMFGRCLGDGVFSCVAACAVFVFCLCLLFLVFFSGCVRDMLV